MTNWGTPDWCDGAVYPTPDGLTRPQWRWEFVRRNNDYRLLWERCASAHAKKCSRTAESLEWAPLIFDRLGESEEFRERFGTFRLFNPAVMFDHMTLLATSVVVNSVVRYAS